MSTDKGKEPVSNAPVTTTTTDHRHDNRRAMYIQLRYSPGGAAFDAIVQPRTPLSLVSAAWLKRTHPKALYYESQRTKYTSYVQLDICIPVRQVQSSPGSTHDCFVYFKQIFYVEGKLVADLVLGGDFTLANHVLIDKKVPSVQFSDQNAIADARIFELPDQLARPVMREPRRVRFAGLFSASNPATASPPVHAPVPSLSPRSGILKRAPAPDPDPAPASDPVPTSTQASVTGALASYEFPPHKEGEDRPNPLGSHPGPALNGGMSRPEPPRPNPTLEPWVSPESASDIASVISDGSSDGSSSDGSFPAPQGKTLYSQPNLPLTTVRIPPPIRDNGNVGISLPILIRATSDPCFTHRKSTFTAPRPAPDAPIRKAFVDKGQMIMLTGNPRNESSSENYRDTLYEVTEGAKGKGPLAPNPPKLDVEQDDGRKLETVINPHSKLDPALASKVGAEEDIAKRVSKKF